MVWQTLHFITYMHNDVFTITNDKVMTKTILLYHDEVIAF